MGSSRDAVRSVTLSIIIDVRGTEGTLTRRMLAKGEKGVQFNSMDMSALDRAAA